MLVLVLIHFLFEYRNYWQKVQATRLLTVLVVFPWHGIPYQH